MKNSNLEQAFKLYLTKTKGLSKRTVKNYLSDYRNFIDWIRKTCEVTPPRCPEVTSGLLGRCDEAKSDVFYQKVTTNTLKRYLSYLSATDLADSTVKRRLSTIRIFCQFLLDQNLIKKDPCLGLENPSDTTPEQEKIEELTTKFRRYLDSEDLSKNTVKNYVADARNYLEWAMNSS